ncbi:16561_t:CDS:2, partial [Racocetra persica]
METSTLTGIFWMSPEQVILWHKFGDSIGHDNIARTNRYHIPLSLFVVLDDNIKLRIVAQALISDKMTESYQWNELIATYPTSTSFVESQNACIKCAIESSNISFYELGNILIDNFEDKQKQIKYEAQIKNISLTNTVTIFPQIKPNVIWFLINQMKESIFYTAYHSNVKEIKGSPVTNPSENENFENESDNLF